MSFIERITVEAKELKDKVNALQDFTRTKEFYKLDRVNKDLLYEQLIIMTKYLQILGKRLELLGVSDFIE